MINFQLYTAAVQERLQKILSARGICSRRKAEEYIEQGLVQVNGKKVKVGDKADPEKDQIEVDGKVIEARKEMLYYVMHKPTGVISSNVVASRGVARNVPTVRTLLPKNLQGTIYPVGRLDKDTSGLLLFTNDGVLSYRLTHPTFDHEKEYEVQVEKPVPEGVFKKLRTGVKVLGSKTKPAKITRLSARRFTITLTEGRNRQIRRMCQKVGFPVKQLKRIRIVTLRDAKIKEGTVRKLTSKEVKDLLHAVDISQ